ncbi:hypothetical protein BOO94_30710 [Pseudomonas sp. FSL W5-0299]|nr:hypothetical protein BOO94_30710 [Pseudomonas sp. FSL W5-0299]
MGLYLYLNEHSHADTWINGGVIPIQPASTYRKLERDGIYTPDENLIHKSPFDLFSLSPVLDLRGFGHFSMNNLMVNGVQVPNVSDVSLYEEDGLILSFSCRYKKKTAIRMKKKACVKILDVDALKKHLDEKLGVEAIAKDCEYTQGHERNHFLKSNADQWQAEFRMFWPILERVEVELPPGVATLMRKW